MSKWYENQPEEILMSGKIHQAFVGVKNLIQTISKNKRVLDIGCNAGTACLIAAQGGAKSVTGIDMKERYISHAGKVLDRWNELNNTKYNIDYKFGNLCLNLELIDEHDVFIFQRVIYHLRTTEEKTEKGFKDGIDSIFGKFSKKKDVVLFIEGNPGRRHLTNEYNGKYGNALATIPGIESLLDTYDFTIIYKDEPKELVIATNSVEAELESIKESVSGC